MPKSTQHKKNSTLACVIYMYSICTKSKPTCIYSFFLSLFNELLASAWACSWRSLSRGAHRHIYCTCLWGCGHPFNCTDGELYSVSLESCSRICFFVWTNKCSVGGLRKGGIFLGPVSGGLLCWFSPMI